VADKGLFEQGADRLEFLLAFIFDGVEPDSNSDYRKFPVQQFGGYFPSQ